MFPENFLEVSGFALLPPGLSAAAAPLAQGMARVFRRAEIPASWPGRELCEDSGNPGLALRLSASLFERTRFQAISIDRGARVVAAWPARPMTCSSARTMSRLIC